MQLLQCHEYFIVMLYCIQCWWLVHVSSTYIFITKTCTMVELQLRLHPCHACSVDDLLLLAQIKSHKLLQSCLNAGFFVTSLLYWYLVIRVCFANWHAWYASWCICCICNCYITFSFLKFAPRPKSSSFYISS